MEKRNWKPSSRNGKGLGREGMSAHTGLSQQKAVRKVLEDQDLGEGLGVGL